MRLAFLGLGVMGYPMAGHLQAAGHEVRVYNRTTHKAEAWVAQHGGSLAKTPAEAAKGVDLVFACVGRDADVREVTLGEAGAYAAMAKGSLFVDHSTISAETSRELASAAEARGLAWLDAPVSGGQAGAEKGALTVMCGGEPDAYAKAEPVMQAYARSVALLGPAGAGQLAKMVNQICIAGVVQGLAEALHFGMQADLPMEAVLEVISKGAAQSWQMENRGSTMLQDSYDFGFAVDWMRKDLGNTLEEAKRLGVSLPLTALVDQFYAEVQTRGGGRWDTSSLLKRFQP